MFRTALRNVLAHKARLLMTVLAVMLGVAFVSGTLVFTNTISDAYQKSSAKGFGQVDVAIQPEGRKDTGDTIGKDPKLTQALLDKAAKVPGAGSTIGVVNGFTAVVSKNGKLVGNGFQSQGGNYWGNKDPRYPLTSGHAPRGGNEVALDSRTAARAGYKVGDTVRLSVDGPVLTPTVMRRLHHRRRQRRGRMAVSPSSTRRPPNGSSTGPHEFDEIDVKAAPGTSQTALRSALGQVVPKDVASTTTGRQLADDQATEIASAMSGMKTGLLVFSRHRAVRRHVHHRQHLHHVGRPAHQGTGAAARRRRLPQAGHPVRARRGVLRRRGRGGGGPGRGYRHRRGDALAHGHPRRHRPGRPAGDLARHGRHGPARRRSHHDARRLAARPPRREDPAGRRDEQRARAGDHQVPRRTQHARRPVHAARASPWSCTRRP